MTTETTTTAHFGAEPHGGTLIDAFAPPADRTRLRDEAQSLPVRELNAREASDVEMIAIGGYSPLDGFMGEADYKSVVHSMHLANDLPWTIPVTLSVSDAEKSKRHAWEPDRAGMGRRADRHHERGRAIHPRRAGRSGEGVSHHGGGTPGVAALYREHATLIAGPIQVFGNLPNQTFPEHRLPPRETRRLFAEREWRTVVGFQTRNPVHRAHEYLQKCALEIVDGLLLHPLVGETKSDDIPADVRMRSYEVLLAKYYPSDRVLLAVNPAGDALRRSARGHFPRLDPQELRLHALYRRARPCRCRQLLRTVRRAAHLSGVRAGIAWHPAAVLRELVLLQGLRQHGDAEDVPAWRRRSSVAQRNSGTRDAAKRHLAATRILTCRSGPGALRRDAGRTMIGFRERLPTGRRLPNDPQQKARVADQITAP